MVGLQNLMSHFGLEKEPKSKTPIKVYRYTNESGYKVTVKTSYIVGLLRKPKATGMNSIVALIATEKASQLVGAENLAMIAQEISIVSLECYYNTAEEARKKGMTQLFPRLKQEAASSQKNAEMWVKRSKADIKLLAEYEKALTKKVTKGKKVK